MRTWNSANWQIRCRPPRGWKPPPHQQVNAPPATGPEAKPATGRGAPSAAPVGANGRARPEFWFDDGFRSQPDLPPAFQSILERASFESEVAAASLVPVLLAEAGAALGNSTILDAGLFPTPINSSFAVIICGPERAAISMAVETLTQALRDAQDAKFADRAEVHPREIERRVQQIEREERAFFGAEPVRDAAAVASFRAKLSAARPLQYRALLVENRAPGTLFRAAASSGGGLLAIYGERTLARLLDAPKLGQEDFELLSRALEGKTPENLLLKEAKAASLVRPVVGCVLTCSPAVLSRLLFSTAPAIHGFVGRAVLARPSESRLASRPGEVTPRRRPDAWAQLVARLVGVRDSGQQRRLTLSSPADALLRKYARECQQPDAEQGRWTNAAPRLAATIALVFHCCGGEPSGEIPFATMAHAIALTRSFVRESSGTALYCAAQQDLERLHREATLMLSKLRSIEPARRRELFRLFDDQRSALHQPVLDHLLDTGQVRYLAGGGEFLESVDHDPEGEP